MAACRSGATRHRSCGALRRSPWQDIVDDLHGRFAARVVRGDHDQVAEPAGDFPHQGAFAPIPVAAATKDADQPSGREWPQGRQGMFQGVRGVGVVDVDVATRRTGDLFKASGHVLEGTDPPADGLRRSTGGNAAAHRRHDVVQVVASHQRRVDVDGPQAGLPGRP